MVNKHDPRFHKNDFLRNLNGEEKSNRGLFICAAVSIAALAVVALY